MRQFTCIFKGPADGGAGCPETEYHRHCVRCGHVVHGRRKKDLICCAECRETDKAWSRQETRVQVYLSESLSEKPKRVWLARSVLDQNGKRGPK